MKQVDSNIKDWRITETGEIDFLVERIYEHRDCTQSNVEEWEPTGIKVK